MDVTIEPHPLSGTVPAVASKSVAHRLLILAALADGTTDIDCNTTSKDIEATVRCLEALGARIARTRLGFRVRPIPRDASGTPLPASGATLDCGESGSTLRFMLPVAAALGSPCALDGHGRLAKRPLSPLYEELASHGARLSQKGVLPLRVEGDLAGGTFDIPGDVSSQYVSGLLMAAPLIPGGVRVRVSEPFESRAYVTITTDALRAFGVDVRVAREREEDGASFEVFEVEPQAVRTPGTVAVEGDWSNSAFWLAAGAISGPVCVTGLDARSSQGDRAIVGAASLLGARARTEGDSATARRAALRGRTVNVAEIPDLVPPIAAMAVYAQGETRITDAARLRLKESDRLETVRAAIACMGGDATVEGDDLLVRGTGSLPGGVVDAANDHRIAMMAAVCAAHAQGPTTIRGAECVAKSYPTFFDDFRSLGGVARESE
jgi:3-phosphoshikimate 1-carboxyvinyltransferase